MVLPRRLSSARAPLQGPRAAVVAPFETLEDRLFMSVLQDSSGFTVITPSSDSRVVYVSSSQGLDTNSGLSQSAPLKTIAKARTLLRNGMPDEMLLKKGDTWYEPLSSPKWSLSGR